MMHQAGRQPDADSKSRRSSSTCGAWWDVLTMLGIWSICVLLIICMIIALPPVLQVRKQIEKMVELNIPDRTDALLTRIERTIAPGAERVLAKMDAFPFESLEKFFSLLVGEQQSKKKDRQ